MGQVLFERSKKAKHLNISVKPYAGVRVAVPDGLSFQKAEEFVHAKKGWIRKHLARMREYEINHNAKAAISDDIDRAEAKRKLTGRLRHLARKYGLTFNRVSIRNQKTRWGSCSNTNNISLNARVLLLPEELMNYVILHELAHTRVKNHSNSFWTLMDRLVGNGKAKAASLRAYGTDYL